MLTGLVNIISRHIVHCSLQVNIYQLICFKSITNSAGGAKLGPKCAGNVNIFIITFSMIQHKFHIDSDHKRFLLYLM